MLHNSLKNYYETNFALVQYHKWSLDNIENMIPWERDIYIQMLMEYLKEEERRYKEQSRKR
ncbi:baseplate hub assembly catalyst [Synechococcus phage S-ShM2]|uniref:Baseplate hub assembly catalyst n=3 Tax=Ahtivirus sagseatwo TaxID=2734079 RepID=A0A1D7SIB1_9CAUD|nr:baseplate hub assembly catalyst [Synechococcus phage S-ShM2]AGH57329.1 hypothetical protein CPLG_00075 [Cyanophage S-SSM2]AOO13124.1 hypothetical protein LIS021110_010 [Cyanophage S-RIM14]ADO97623.1 base plate hub assembly catalyst gp51 [Synechococcus phage S-ShM2]AOO13340.1 hypothetical protein LIS110610_010 [Cyanophage S-RIM14]AOO13556.1 hypothetical protein Np111211_010 [Cyanophage S-RIM14]